MSLTDWFHDGLGSPIGTLVSIEASNLQTSLTPGGLLAAWMRLAWTLEPEFEPIGDQAKASAILRADDTGGRIEGQACWLWCQEAPKPSHPEALPTRPPK